MATNVDPRDTVLAFCRAWEGSHTIHVEIHEEGLVKDVQEYGDDWGEDRPEAVADYVDGRRAKVSAMRRTGHRRGADDEWRTLATLEALPGPHRGTATIRHMVSFRGLQMGCKALGYCEREGRDRTEEQRRYGEFLASKGIHLVEFENGWAVVRATEPTPGIPA